MKFDNWRGSEFPAVERRRLLLADTVVKLSFQCTDELAVLVGSTLLLQAMGAFDSS